MYVALAMFLVALSHNKKGLAGWFTTMSLEVLKTGILSVETVLKNVIAINC